ncbi:bromodomain-containing protein 4A-like [Ochlerotatus camptorhynchus]|uniref:bromodomain-containing protein 4A-like n=1 Tax=Ochlerotatus camptorhynchus TaxID=644619 RepID=UPI0031D15838
MRKCYLLLLLPVVFGARPPAAVFEDVFELGRPSIAFHASPVNQNGMQAYLSKRNRQLADYTLATAGSRYHYHTAASERYQSYEETQNDRIRLENLQKIANVRTKRLDSIAKPRQAKKLDIIPREVFRFTLADAMIHPQSPERLSGDSKRVKRDEGRSGKRVEPVPREILWFKLQDAITQNPITSTVEEGNVHHRRKRSADPGVNKDGREMVQFELQDAKTPDRDAKLYNKQLKEENPNLRMPFTTSDTFKRGSVFDEVAERPDSRKRDTKKDKRDSPMDDKDMSTEESRRVKITRGNKKKMANYEDLPLGVQKAIDIAIKENERMNTKSGEEPTRPPKYHFGDKKPKTKKPFSSTTSPKMTFQSPKDTKFSPSPQVETGFVPSKPSKPTKSDSSENLKPEKATPATWWDVSNLNRPKRLHQKASYPPLVIHPQYVNTYKPTMETYKMKELSPGYEQSQENAYEYEGPKEVVIQEKPKVQYVIKEIPVPVRPKEPRTKIIVHPAISISYDKESSAPASSQESNHPDYNNPYGPVELRYEQPKEAKPFQGLKIIVPDSKEQSQPSYYTGNHVEQHQSSESSQSDESYEKTGSSIAALSALIGKRPTVQLKGLNELLHMPVPIGNAQPLQTMKTRVRPQDSTAPIMFPAESSTPHPTFPRKTTGYRSVKIENGPKIVYEDSPNPSTLYHTVLMNPQLKVPMTKDYTPIKEVVADISDSDLVGPTVASPTHATYIIGSTPVSPTIESNSYGSEANSHESASYQQIQAIHTTPETIVEPINVQYQTRDPGHKQQSHYHHQQHYEESKDDHEHHHHHFEHDDHEHHHHYLDHDDHLHDHYGHQDHHDHQDHHQHEDDSEDNDDSEGYAFGYRVRDFHTGNDFGHIQNRDNGVTRGEYHILLPDGRVQNVRYTADEKGFHAEVSYESVPTPHESSPSSSASGHTK